MDLINELKEFGLSNHSNRVKWLGNALADIQAGSSIIDIGAGQQQYRKFCKHLKYTSQDFNQYDGTGNSEGLQTGVWDTSKIDIVSDLISIPVHDQSFDAILCTEVLEHVPNPIEAIKEFSRLIKPNGQLIITAPFASLTHFAPYHYSTGFSKYFYMHHLEKEGFKILEIYENGNYADYMAQELKRVLSIFGKKSFLMKPLIYSILLIILKNRQDENIKNLASFGYHIRAQKIKS